MSLLSAFSAVGWARWYINPGPKRLSEVYFFVFGVGMSGQRGGMGFGGLWMCFRGGRWVCRS